MFIQMRHLRKYLTVITALLLLFFPCQGLSQINFTGHLITDEFRPMKIKTGDLDNDNDIDIVVLCVGDSTIWLENDGDGGFNEHLITRQIPLWSELGIYDLDNDSDEDIVSCRNTVVWLENDGFMNFDNDALYDTNQEGQFVTHSDVDSDGDWDLVVCEYGGSLVCL